MIQPNEMKKHLPMSLSNGIVSTTTKVWEVLSASKNGDIATIKNLVNECPELAYAQYNYTPPIHFAVREGHIELVNYLLGLGEYSPQYKTYPFQEPIQVIAQDRGYNEILDLLDKYGSETAGQKFKGDNGEILYSRNEEEKLFEKSVYEEDLKKTEEILVQNPVLAKDETYFWGEGILTFAVKENNRPLIDLLLRYGAKVPDILKWTQFYYFEHNDGATYILEKGMNPNTMSWQRVTILHDMAQKGNLYKADLLLNFGAEINLIDEEYQSTPLGMAARWGHIEMVKYLLKHGADPNKAGTSWSTPLAWAKKKGHPDIEEILLNEGAIAVPHI